MHVLESPTIPLKFYKYCLYVLCIYLVWTCSFDDLRYDVKFHMFYRQCEPMEGSTVCWVFPSFSSLSSQSLGQFSSAHRCTPLSSRIPLQIHSSILQQISLPQSTQYYIYTCLYWKEFIHWGHWEADMLFSGYW